MKNTRVRIEGKKYTDEKQVVPYEVECMTVEARMAASFVERWGLVAGVPDGEDSAGRQRMRLPTPEELATRAFDISQAFFAEARKRDLMVELPDLNEVNAEHDAQVAKEEQQKREKEAARAAERTS